MSTMTLEQAIAVLNPEPKSYQAIEAWKVVRAHLAQPAQAVDVVTIKQVIKSIRHRGCLIFTGFNAVDQARCNEWADKLTRAIAGR